VNCVKQAVEEGEKTDSFVRVFTLGVGASVSHYLIESVARAGRGYAQLVVTGEPMETKVVNMLKAALIPTIKNLHVSWTGGDAVVDDTVKPIQKPVNLFDEADVLPPPPPPFEVVTPIQQAPFRLPAFSRGVRFTVYAILSSETRVPEKLVVEGTATGGQPVYIEADVVSISSAGTMLHTLAARALVRDLEEGASYIHALGGTGPTNTDAQMLKRLGVKLLRDGEDYSGRQLSDKVVADLSKEKIVELALKYNLSTKYTSWVAVDRSMKTRNMIRDPVGVIALDSSGVSTAKPYIPHVDTGASEKPAPSAAQSPAVVSASRARLRSILQHQRFDGVFPLVPEIAALLSTTVAALKATLGEFRKGRGSGLQLSEPEWETLWATCLAVQLVKKQLPDLQGEWDLVVEKAEKRVAAMVKSADKVAAIQQAASEVVKP
jgi:hypothetical protein